MDELSVLEQLINLDGDFATLTKEANTNTNTLWDSNADELLETKHSVIDFNKMQTDEFFAYYKCILFFAACIGKALNKIHAEDRTDGQHALLLKNTGNKALIYHSPRPWQTHFKLFLETTLNPQMFVEEDITVWHKSIQSADGILRITFLGPKMMFNPPAMSYTIDYLAIPVKVAIEFESGREWSEVVELKSFTIDTLTGIIERSEL